MDYFYAKVLDEFFIPMIWNNLNLLRLLCLLLIPTALFLITFIIKNEDKFFTNKKQENFDKELFKNSNTIMNEVELNDFLEEIVHLRYSRKLADKIDDFIKYFKQISNQYFNKEIKNTFDIFYTTLENLMSNVYVKSIPHPTLYKNNVFRLFTDSEELNDKKYAISQEFSTMCNEVEKLYANYRNKIKEKFCI